MILELMKVHNRFARKPKYPFSGIIVQVETLLAWYSELLVNIVHR